MVESLDEAVGLGVIWGGPDRYHMQEPVYLQQFRHEIRALVGEGFFRNSDPGDETDQLLGDLARIDRARGNDRVA